MVGSVALLLGTALQLVAYRSVELIAVGVLFFGVCGILLCTTPLGGRVERAMFTRVFAVGWLAAGIAAIYANYFGDLFQNTSDAAHFFDLATQESIGLSLTDLKAVTEGGGAVILWQWIYNLFAGLGFEKARYIGISVNVAAVALSGVVVVKISRRIFGNDAARERRLITLFSSCGMLWLYASLHLRDSVILLSVSALTYCWIRYLTRSGVLNLLLVGLATLLGFAALGLLRAEFAFVPAAMMLAALAAIMLFDRSRGARKLFAYGAAAIGVVIAALVFLALRDQVLLALGMGYEGYLDELGSETQMDDSLGAKFIAGAPLPFRLIFGSAYLFVFPIPFWSGFQLESAYHLFKSCNVLYFYLLVPLLALALLRILRDVALRTPAIMFLLFTVLGFMLAIAGTSLENRHFGSFFAALVTLALIPDLRAAKDRTAYRLLALAFVAAMLLVHVAWAMLKFG